MNFPQKTFYKLKYKNGKFISRFIAHDVKKEIVVVDDSKIEQGVLLIRERVINVLYLAKIEGYELPEFSEPKLVKISSMWNC